jgi:hypothetical protein
MPVGVFELLEWDVQQLFSEVEPLLRAEGFRRASRESDGEEGSIPDIPWVWYIPFRAGEYMVDLDLSKTEQPLMGPAEVPDSAVCDFTEEVEGAWTVRTSTRTMESKSVSRCILKGGGALTNRPKTCNEAAGSHPRPDALVSAVRCCQLGSMRLILLPFDSLVVMVLGCWQGTNLCTKGFERELVGIVV